MTCKISFWKIVGYDRKDCVVAQINAKANSNEFTTAFNLIAANYWVFSIEATFKEEKD